MYRVRSSVVTMIRATPSACRLVVSAGIDSAPTASCPPVIAAAPLWSRRKVRCDPAATAARTASEPEWWNVPSPMFCTKWSASTNGSMPSQCAPSPPIWLRPVTSPTCSSGISSTIVWQPMPAPTREPSGIAVVEVLCGQPEQ